MTDPYPPRPGSDPQQGTPHPGQYGGASAQGSSGHGASPWQGEDQRTQPMPHPAQQYDTPQYVDPHYAQGGGQAVSTPRKFSGATVLASALVASLVGAGAALGVDGLNGSDGGYSAAANTSPVIVNDTESVNEITAATQKASPSAVTISASGGNEQGSGSGVVIDDRGHIVTNTHVVTLDGTTSDAKIEVRTADGNVRPGQIVGTDPESDLAVVKVDPAGLTPAEFGDSDKLNVGDTVLAIGAPLGLTGTVTDGIVSTLNRTISVASSAAPDTPVESEQSPGGPQDFFFNLPENGQSGAQAAKSSVYLNVIQTDAAINPGNSGGPLVNSAGQVIGINVAIASAAGSSNTPAGSIGVGFSIPSNTVKRVAREIIDNGKATHGYLGASVSANAGDGGTSSQFSRGALVQRVESGSPAGDAGLRKDDVVTELNGKRIEDADALTATVRELAAGSTVEMRYLRDGRSRTASVTVADAAKQR